MLNGLTLYIGKIILTPMTEVSFIPLKLTIHDCLYMTAVATDATVIKHTLVQNF